MHDDFFSTRTVSHGSSYMGGLCDGMPHGKGIFKQIDLVEIIFPKEDEVFGNHVMFTVKPTIYDGGWEYGKMHGQGILSLPAAKYEGQWKDGRMHGWGELIFPNHSKYHGEWKSGKMFGEGTFTFVSSDEPWEEWVEGEGMISAFHDIEIYDIYFEMIMALIEIPELTFDFPIIREKSFPA